MSKVLDLLKEIESSMFGKCPVCTFIVHREGCRLGQAIAILEARVEPGELVKATRKLLKEFADGSQTPYAWLLTIGVSHVLKLCDEIERQEKEAFGLSVTKVSAENECMVLKGQIERLEARLSELAAKGMEKMGFKKDGKGES